MVFGDSKKTLDEGQLHSVISQTKSFTYVVFIFEDILFSKTLDEGKLLSIISHE